MKAKTSWEHVKVNNAHLSGAKASVNHKKVSPRNAGNSYLRLSQYQKFNNAVVLVFLELSEIFRRCLSVVCQNSGEVWRGLRNRCRISLSDGKNREAALLVFPEVSGTKNSCETGVSQFFDHFYCLTVPKFVQKAISGVCEYLPVLCIGCICML